MFDVDLTLTPARNKIQENMLSCIERMRAKGIHFGIVSGSDLIKVTEQVGLDLVNSAEYCFAENGLYAMESGKFLDKQSFKDYLGEERLK